MTNEPFDPMPAASMLADAWRSGELLSELPAAVRPRTLAQGYDVQDRLVESLGELTTGWKLGVGSIAQKRQSGVGRSIAGRILGSRLFRAGDTVRLPSAAPVTIEFEIAYILGRDVEPHEPEFPVLEAVAETRVAFELVRSRFIDRRAVGWPSFAADNAGFHALVLGVAIEPARVAELAATLVLTVDGREAARSLAGDDATDPAAALADLVATARERGTTLPKGSIVSTGTVSKPFDIAAPAAAIGACCLGMEFGFRTLVEPPHRVQA
jgi:2-keto-4-pentenoate hydratase